MKYFIHALIFSIFFLLSTQIANAAPAPWQIAINEETNQCGGFWAGDEYGQNELPEGWVAYSVDRSLAGASVETENGSCFFGDTFPFEDKGCCEQLGYEYVSEQIGVDADDSKDFTQSQMSFTDRLLQALSNFIASIF